MPPSAGPSTAANDTEPCPCPLCGFQSVDTYTLLLHFEYEHNADDSPFLTSEERTTRPDGPLPATFNPLDYDFNDDVPEDDDKSSVWVECSEDGCEELVMLMELQNHMDMHAAENMTLEDAQPSPSASRDRSASPRADMETRKRRERNEAKGPRKPETWVERAAMVVAGPKYLAEGARKKEPSSATSYVANGKAVRRLGKADLGPYAHEKQMPDWLFQELSQGARFTSTNKIDTATGKLIKVVSVANETPDLVPVIALLCDRDPEVRKAWVCHPAVKHIGKQIKGEGGFCGYRNIQMMASYIQAATTAASVSNPFPGRMPTIPKLQELIEEGWDKGINVNGRLETGGIIGTRKYIGTSEAQTLLRSLSIRAAAHAFSPSPGEQTQNALLDCIASYFRSERPDSTHKVTRTKKPPIYFQHSGHSMTIVGYEERVDGSRNLLVFDPYFQPSNAIKECVGRKTLRSNMLPEKLLRAYRRRMGYLAKYKEFEFILLDGWP